MPVLFNNQSGLAENLPDEVAQQALQSGTHEVPLMDPNGEIGSAPHDEAPGLISQGYKQPAPEQLQHLLTKAKYSTPGQKLIGAAEQVAQGIAGPIPTMVETALGVPKEDISGRAEAKGTGEKMLEQGLGLVGSAFIPGGQAKILEAAGELGAHALGIGEAASTFGKIGTSAAKAAIENAVYESGNQTTKAILADPEATASNAIMHVGLAGLIGGGFGGALGAVPPIWEATLGPKTENFLRSISNRANGETLPLSEDLTTVLTNMERAGKSIPPEIRAGLSENPLAHDYFNELRESGTTTGDALRATVDQFKNDVGDQLKSVFQEQGPTTAFEAGEKAKEAIITKANDINNQISAQYAEVMPHLEAIAMPKAEREAFHAEMLDAGKNFGAKGSAAEGMFKNYADRALAQDTISQLKQLNTEISSELSVARRAGDFEKARALSEIKGNIKSFQDNQVIRAGEHLEQSGVIEAKGLAKGLIEERNAADKAYAKFMDSIGEVAAAGKLGKVRSHGQLLEALDNVPSAKLADKLFDPKNIEGLRYLQKNFEGVLEPLIQAKKTSMIEAATTKGDLMHNQLLNAVNKLPKEVRDLMFTKEEMHTINASGKILRESTKRLNPSGTGLTIDKLMQNLPAGVGAMAGALMGHNPMVGFMMGHVGKFIGRDAPDAAKASLLKFLGSPEVIEGSAWKSMADYFHAAQRGEAMLTKASKAVIKAGQDVLPASQMPDEKSRENLNKRLLALKDDPSDLINTGGKIGHYAPDHATAMGQMAANTVNYLNSLRPTKIQMSPLDVPFEAPFQQERFDNALDVAQQPLTVLQDLKDGTMLPNQIVDLKTMYPKLYESMSRQLVEDMTSHLADGEEIPYRTQVGLSQFLGQPLDSSMTPQSILAIQLAQNRSAAHQQAQEMQQSQAPKGKSVKSLNKMSQGYATATQAREGQRQSSKV